MALRQLIPDFEPGMGLGEMSGSQLLRLKSSEKVEFRAGADSEAVARDVLQHSRVSLEAAVAGGKSTRIPAALVRVSNLLVVHLCPNRFLADDLAKYVAANAASGLPCVHLEEPGVPWPDEGLVFMSTACLVARWLTLGTVAMPECVVFHDESHESDGFCYLVRTLLPQLEAVRTYVSATATSVAAGFRAMESGGSLQKREFSAADGERQWDVFDTSKPWCPDTMSDNCLIFEDRKHRAEALKADFLKAGWEVYRFHGGMSLREFRRVVGRMRLPNTPCIAIIADSTFRSGFTLPVTTIIDSGYVGMVVAADGMPRRIERKATGLERYQAAARGGRMVGQKTVYYSPDFDAPAVIHDLEASEIDLAALCLRLFGYGVPRELAGCYGAVMDVPRTLAAVFRGGMPLGALKPEQLVPMAEFATPAGRRSPCLAEGYEIDSDPYDMHPRVSSDTAAKHGLQTVRRRTDSVVQGQADEVVAPAPLRPVARARLEPVLADTGGGASLDGALNDLYSCDGGSQEVEPDKCYVPVGVGHGDVSAGAFPRGVESVLAQLALDGTGALHAGYDEYTRGVAVNLLVDRHNELSCKISGCRAAIVGAREAGGGIERGALREWAMRVAEALAKAVHELRVVDRVLERVLYDFSSLAEVDFSRHIADIEAGLSGVVRALPGDKRYVEAVGRGVSRVALGGASAPRIEPPTVAMPTVGRGMRAVARPRSVAEWMAGPAYYSNRVLK